MNKLQENNKLFTTYKYARYSTEIKLQQSYRPSGSVQEWKKHYSGKHRLHGYEVEFSVVPSAFAIGCSAHYSGSTSNLTIFQKNQECNQTELEKETDEHNLQADAGQLFAEYPKSSAVPSDKAYQGAAKFQRLICAKKKPKNGELARLKELRNRLVSSDRNIVENIFGRVTRLWNLLSAKLKWSEKTYDSYFQIDVGLTNMHFRWGPHRADDRVFINELGRGYFELAK